MNGCNTVFPRDTDCLKNISINTLHKGDDYDDDDDDDENENVNNERNNISKALTIKYNILQYF